MARPTIHRDLDEQKQLDRLERRVLSILRDAGRRMDQLGWRTVEDIKAGKGRSRYDDTTEAQ